jgi:transcriptional regulator with XRE-family HTH domain
VSAPTPQPRTPGDGVPTGTEAFTLRALLGGTLKKYRDRAGMSQATLAERAGVDRRTVERLESGQRRPTPAMLAALADALADRDAEAAVDIAARLAIASGASLRVDTSVGVERRMRRLEAATRFELHQLAAERAGGRMVRVRARRGAGRRPFVSPKPVKTSWTAAELMSWARAEGNRG